MTRAGVRGHHREFDMLFMGQRLEVSGGPAQQLHQVNGGEVDRHFSGVEFGDVEEVFTPPLRLNGIYRCRT